MSDDSDRRERAHEVWEYEIDELRRKAAQTFDEDDGIIRDEKAAIVECLLRSYEQRFGISYPGALDPL